jgi:tetratricopeptide (TPR) repeat protein
MALFGFLNLATQARWLSAWVAMLFAVHPLHVESVVWISERKDVLCALFWFLALWAWVRYTRIPSAGRYLLALGAFALGLMSKPMIVTLPVLLLLLDFWPLNRRSGLREKLPFFALSGVVAVVAYLAQRQSGAVGAVELYPWLLRAENALVSYVTYVGQVFWPARLAVFCPYPRAIPIWQAALAAAALAAITILIFRFARARPYLVTGWLWYLVALLPVIGLAQVGAQARADRYMYVPMVGLAVMLAWGIADLFRRLPKIAALLAAASSLLFAVAANAQVRCWRDSEALFRHALDVTVDNYVAHNNLGAALSLLPGRLPEAIAQYQAALSIFPGYADAHNNLGSALAQTGRLPAALAEFQAAVRAQPGFADAHNNLANAFAQSGHPSDAVAEYRAALRISPGFIAAHFNLGALLMRTPGGLAGAVAEFRAALALDPRSPQAHNNLATALALTPGGRMDAIAELRAALAIDPAYARAHYNLANLLGGDEAIAEYKAALRINPAYADAHYNLAVILAETGRTAEAVAEYEATLRLQPDSAKAHYNLGVVLLKVGRQSEALAHLEIAQRISPNPAVERVVERLKAGAR